MSRTFNSIAAGLLLALSTTARADIYVVVSTSSPQRSLTQKEAVDLFMGRTRTLQNGEYAVMLDLPKDHGVRQNFYQALTGMSLAQVNSYWSRLMFTGLTLPPHAMPTEQAMIDMVKRNHGAMGYVGTEPNDPGLRTLIVLKTPG